MHPLRQFGRPVWDNICRHIDGLAIGSSVAALDERGVFHSWRDRTEVSFRELFGRRGGNPGYLHVALRLMACQGWMIRKGEHGTENMTFFLLPEGKIVAQCADHYKRAAGFLPHAQELVISLAEHRGEDARELLAEIWPEVEQAWNLPYERLPAAISLKIRQHLDGHIVGPLMAGLGLREWLPLAPDFDWNASAKRAFLEWDREGYAGRILSAAGWMEGSGSDLSFTARGKVASACAGQYLYPVSYLPTLIRVPRLLSEDLTAIQPRIVSGQETHVSRELDILFSGGVFDRTCRGPFLEIAQPIFDHLPLSEQPGAIVDTGCGNGALLQALYEHIRDHCERGRHLDRHPLAVVGVEPSEPARRTTQRRLDQAMIPNVVIDGDIGDPAGLKRELIALGVDPYDALHICKSVIHNRNYIPPTKNVIRKLHRATSTGAFVAGDGTAIPNVLLEESLVLHFNKWADLYRKHGALVIEAHTAPEQLIASLGGRTVATLMDATHGYSNQYLLEPDVFQACATAAGYKTIGHKDIGRETVGHVVLTMDHFVPRDR